MATWVKLDDGFFLNPKAMTAGKDGRELYLAALCWSSANLTDGFIPEVTVRTLCLIVDVDPDVTALLVVTGLWERVEDGWMIHDYLEHQTSKEQVGAKRAKTAERVRRWRDQHKSDPSPQSNGVSNASRNGVSNADVTAPDTDTDTDTDTEKTHSPSTAPARAPRAQVREIGPSFDEFWTQYPRKVSKQGAERAWRNLSAGDRRAALDALPAHVSLWATKDAQHIPHPPTWLNGRRWEDDLTRELARAPRLSKGGQAYANRLRDLAARERANGDGHPAVIDVEDR